MTTSNGDDLRFTAVMSYGVGRTAMNVFDVRVLGTTPMDDIDIMEGADLYLSEAYGLLDAWMATATVPVEIRGFNTTTGQPLPTTPWTHWAGPTANNTITADGVAGLVLFRTGRVRVLGRKFLPFPIYSGIVDGYFTAGMIADAASWGAAIAAGYNYTAKGIAFDFRINAKFNGMWPAIDVVASAIPAYQRRRRPGRGV